MSASFNSNDIALAERIAVALESIAWDLMTIRKHFTEARHEVPGVDEAQEIKIEGVLADDEPTVDAAALAREAEELLNAASTPEVRTVVNISEGERAQPVLNKINLFHQDRHDIADLVECYPNDPIIKEYLRKRDSPDQFVTATNVLAAAIGLVYKNLPHDLWGGEAAASAIKQFVAQHSEDE